MPLLRYQRLLVVGLSLSLVSGILLSSCQDKAEIPGPTNTTTNPVKATEKNVEKVRVAIAQIRLAGKNVTDNLAKVRTYVEKATSEGAQIVVFPELVDVGTNFPLTAPTSEFARTIPGATSEALGSMARQHNIWIATAIYEKVAKGVYNTNILIDNQGRLVLKQRKAFVYPSFGKTPVFQGNYHDVEVVDSPWGPIGVMNCVDTRPFAKRNLLVKQDPALMLVTLKNPGAHYLAHINDLATECNCPAVGVNMVFPSGTKGGRGGKSRFVASGGRTLWQAEAGLERIKTWELTLNHSINFRPRVSAGEVRTIRLPHNTITLNGYVADDGFPDGHLATSWAKVSGPGIVSWGNAHAVTTSVSFSTAGVYRLRLTADDGSLLQADDVIITVLPLGSGDPNLVGYWTFDYTSADASEQGNHGTLFGNPRYSPDVAPSGFPNNGSLDLDGRDDYVRVDHHNSLNAEHSITIALWVKPRSYPGFWPTGNDWASLLNKGAWKKPNYRIGFGAYFYLYADGMGMRIPSLDDSMRLPNKWYHVTVVLDASKGQGKIYINGTLDHMVKNTASVLSNSNPLFIGTFDPSTTKIDGKIDDVRLYTRPLSDAEISAMVPGAVANQAPQIDAGSEVTTKLLTNVVLRGTYADDGWPKTSATAGWTVWRKVSGPGDVHFANRYATTTTATFTKPGIYVLELRASDGAHLVYDATKVTVATNVQ